MPARMPIGVPINVPIVAISTLPAIAFSKPPLLPGGGVICVNRSVLNAWNPACSNVNRIHSRNARPNAIVTSDMIRLKRLTNSRREYSGVMLNGVARLRAAALALGKLQQQQLGERKNNERDDEQDEPELDQRRRVEVTDRFSELVCQRRRNAVAGGEN